MYSRQILHDDLGCVSYLIADRGEAAEASAELLRAAGIWNLVGVSRADPPAWQAAGIEVRSAHALAPDRLVPRLEDNRLTLIDVRDPAEWGHGHVERSRSLPLPELGDGREGGPVLEGPIAVVCASGTRAALAASILRRRGHDPVWRVSGAIDALAAAGAAMVGSLEP